MDSYHENHPFSSESWAAIDGDKRDHLGIMAAQLLNRTKTYAGTRSVSGQALQFPADGLVDRNGDYLPNGTTPDDIKDAQAELAHWLNTNANRVEDNRLQLQDIRALPGGLSFGGGAAREPIPEKVLEMVRYWTVGGDVISLYRV